MPDERVNEIQRSYRRLLEEIRKLAGLGIRIEDLISEIAVRIAYDSKHTGLNKIVLLEWQEVKNQMLTQGLLWGSPFLSISCERTGDLA